MFCNADTLVAFTGDARVEEGRGREGVGGEEGERGEDILAMGEEMEGEEERDGWVMETGCIFRRTTRGWLLMYCYWRRR